MDHPLFINLKGLYWYALPVSSLLVPWNQSEKKTEDVWTPIHFVCADGHPRQHIFSSVSWFPKVFIGIKQSHTGVASNRIHAPLSATFSLRSCPSSYYGHGQVPLCRDHCFLAFIFAHFSLVLFLGLQAKEVLVNVETGYVHSRWHCKVSYNVLDWQACVRHMGKAIPQPQ